MPQKGKGGKQKRSKHQHKVSRSLLVIAEPEEPVPVDITASEGGGMSDTIASRGESSRMSNALGSKGGLYSPPHVLISTHQCQLSSFPSQFGWKGAQRWLTQICSVLIRVLALISVLSAESLQLKYALSDTE